MDTAHLLLDSSEFKLMFEEQPSWASS